MTEKKYVDLANDIKILITVILKQARRDLENCLAKQGADISCLGFGVLHLLALNEQTIKELSDKMMLAPATLVPVIDQLENKKLIKRQIDKTDRRRTPLVLTPAGQQIVASVKHNDKIDSLARKLQDLGDQKSRELLEGLHQLGAAIIGQETLEDILKKVKANK